MVQLSGTLAASLTQRLADFNTVAGNPIQYRVLGQTADDSGAIIYLQPISQASGQPYPGIVDWAVARRTNGAWTVYLPGDPGYSAAYDHLPPDIRQQATAAPYQLNADPALAGLLGGYQFPWDDGTWATVTRSYAVHGTGRIDFDLSNHDVTAAKDGLIVYADNSHTLNAYASAAWWYWNTVVIQHGAHEFSLYGHLAPGSLPQWIKASCKPQCALAVKAGQVIAQEGSTGYSSNPHLHLEFGQQWGIATYMDTADENHDGDRTEPITAAYVYAEQNVGISGYTPEEVAAWPFGTLQQAVHSPPPPSDTNLLVNGDFSAGTTGWMPSGQLNWQVDQGVLRFLRLRTSAPPQWASFYQDDAAGIRAHTPFEATIQLGNASGLAKTVTISIFNRSGRQYGSIECRFSLVPNTPLTLYTIRGATVKTWAGLRFEIGVTPPDGSPAALADNAALQVRPNLAINDTQCITPP